MAQAARGLGADLINLGVGGSAFCEPEIADYMASRQDWHVASLCLSVNMIGGGFSPEQFRERAGYLVRQLGDTGRPVLCLSILPYFGDICADVEGNHGKGYAPAFRQILAEIVEAAGENVELLERSEAMTDLHGLSADLIHPADDGMIEIGRAVSGRLQRMLD